MRIFHRSVVALALLHARRRAGLVRRTVRLESGETLAYLEGGDGPPLLLLHGFGGSKDHFVRVAALLAGTHRVVIPDHLGFGESDKPPHADYAPPAQARRLRAFTAALGLGPAHVGGNSMGGHIALTYAALYPDQVQSLWLLNAGGVWSAPPGELAAAYRRTGRNLLVVRDPAEFADVVAFVMHRPPRVPRAFLAVLGEARAANLALERNVFAQVTADSVEARVAGLPVPTLVVWGAEDRVLSPATAEVLRGLLPNAEVVVLPEVGHLPMVEAPDRCAADYRAFRARLDATAAAMATASRAPGRP